MLKQKEGLKIHGDYHRSEKTCDIQWNQLKILRNSGYRVLSQYTKHQRVTDILNSLGLGVKVSFAILDSSALQKIRIANQVIIVLSGSTAESS